MVGGVFLVDPQAFPRHRSSQTQRGWRWQTWSDTAEVLRKRPSPELPSTHTNTGWQQWFTRTNLWFSSWLCPLCDQMSCVVSAQRITHQRGAPDGCVQREYGGKKDYKRKLSQGRNNKDSQLTQPPQGRKDLDWCILSSWQSLFYVRYEARLMAAVSAPFYTVILQRVSVPPYLHFWGYIKWNVDNSGDLIVLFCALQGCLNLPFHFSLTLPRLL